MDDWHLVGQQTEEFKKVTMLLSPSFTAAGSASWTLIKNTVLSVDAKYVGKQYWDNTQNADRCIPAYWVANASLSHEFTLGPGTLGLGIGDELRVEVGTDEVDSAAAEAATHDAAAGDTVLLG